MALDLTNLATRQANSRSASCCGVGSTLVTTFRFARARRPWRSAVCSSMPPPTRFMSRRRASATTPAATASTRTLIFFAISAQGIRRVGRRDQHLEKLRGRQLRPSYHVDLAVEGNDAAKGGGGIGRERLAIASSGRRRDRDAAGVGVLDDDARGFGKRVDAFPGRVAIGNVVVRKLLALQLRVGRRSCQERAIRRDRTPPADAGSRRSADPAP